jgi:hypothetical protein
MPINEQIAAALPDLITGQLSQSGLARQLGVHPSTVNRAMQRDNIQQLIKDAQVKLLTESLDNAVQNQQDKIRLSTKIIAQVDKDQPTHPLARTMLELGDRAEQGLLQATGIHQAHTQSIAITNILIDNRTELSPVVESMLSARLGSVIQDAIDADFDE